MFGNELQLLVDLLMGKPPEEGFSMDAPGFAKELEVQLEEVHHQVQSALKFSRKVMKWGYDMKVSHVTYRERDKV